MEGNPIRLLGSTCPEMNTFSSMFTQSQYAKVIFHDIWDWYPTDADIVCRYTITKGVVTNAEDKVALLPVGWTSATKDAILSIPAPKQDSSCNINGDETGESCRQGSVVFKVQNIQKDLLEFYQICYLAQNDSGAVSICGASAPFQFRSPQHSGDWCEVEDEEDGILIVRSRAAVDQENLQKALKQGELIGLEKKQIELELDKVTKELSECQLEAKKLKQEIENLKTERKELQERITIGEQIERHMLRLQGEARALDADRNEADSRLNHAQRHIEVLEATIGTLTADKEHILELLRGETNRNAEMSKKTEEMGIERESLKKQLQNLKEEKEMLNTKLELALEELVNLKTLHKLNDEEASKNMESLRETLLLTKKELESKKQKIEELEEICRKKSKLLESEQEEVRQLQEQVKEMQTRLEMAAEEYRKVYAAHVRAERKLSKRQHSASGRGCNENESGGVSSSTRQRKPIKSQADTSTSTDGETGEFKVKSNASRDQLQPNTSPSDGENHGGVVDGNFGRGRALESLHEMNICFVCPVCGVTFPPGDSSLFSSHFQNHLS